MGVGKSTISEKLSHLLLCKHIDLDKYIEKSEGMSINEIFANRGEVYFRERESLALKEILSGEHPELLILSLGGGALISESNSKFVKEKTTCIYLKANFDTISKRLVRRKLGRPYLKEVSEKDEIEKIKELFAIREEGYLKSATHVITTDNKNITQLVSEIIALI